MIQTVTVEKEFSGNRVDKFLSEQFPDLSRSYIQKLIKDGHVTANGKIVKANYKLNALDTLALDKPELQEPDIVPENISIDILYEALPTRVRGTPYSLTAFTAPLTISTGALSPPIASTNIFTLTPS